ncbi:MAG: thiamine phosphate synthase [Desulfatiglans sp.]|nr:thiamine phosphate synthase [Desulfatiglans sp.]
MKSIGRFHLITDTVIQSRFSHVELARMAIMGGADTIQYRSKTGSTREMIDTAIRIKALCAGAGIPLIINDRVDVAIASGADGVHLGDDDFPIPLARKLLGPDAIIGGSAGNINDALRCLNDGADYIGSGPVYGTKTKSDAGDAIGVETIRIIAEKIHLPVVAIGGITVNDVHELFTAGAHGVAVISAVCLSDEPEREARRIRNLLGL